MCGTHFQMVVLLSAFLSIAVGIVQQAYTHTPHTSIIIDPVNKVNKKKQKKG